MTARAKDLLRWMIWRAGRNAQLWWSQTRIAEDLRWSVRTVQRYLSELVKLKGVDVVMRGPRSAMYNLCSGCGKLLESGVPFGGPSQLYLFNEITTPKEKTALQKPPVENKEKNLIELPPRTVTNEYGRTDINPDYVAIVTILRAASSRIASARFPVRYEQAILRREMLRLGLLRETDPEPTLRKPAAFECAWPESRRLKA